jgi:hypothetical protein
VGCRSSKMCDAITQIVVGVAPARPCMATGFRDPMVGVRMKLRSARLGDIEPAVAHAGARDRVPTPDHADCRTEHVDRQLMTVQLCSSFPRAPDRRGLDRP